MPKLIERCLTVLESAGVELSPGLAPGELIEIERKFGFAFGPDHRDLLIAVVPIGPRWVDWRRDAEEQVRHRLDGPVEGALFDVGHNAFWPASWGPRPQDDRQALELARQHLESWPTLVPIYGHRFMPAGPSSRGAPVFSVVQTDVIYYGANLLDYFHHEFGGKLRTEGDPVTIEVPLWSLLATDCHDADL